jgi:hypothetical protein
MALPCVGLEQVSVTRDFQPEPWLSLARGTVGEGMADFDAAVSSKEGGLWRRKIRASH